MRFFSQFRSLSFFYARFCRVRFFFAFAVAKQVNVNIASVIMHNNNKSMDLRYHIWFVLKIGRFFFSSHVEKLYLYACTCLRANLTVTFLYLALEISMSFTLELIKKLFSSFVFFPDCFSCKTENSINLREKERKMLIVWNVSVPIWLKSFVSHHQMNHVPCASCITCDKKFRLVFLWKRKTPLKLL